MAIPKWAANTLYQPGAFVLPKSGKLISQSPPTNFSFETDLTGWTITYLNGGAGPGVVQSTGQAFNGTGSAYWAGAAGSGFKSSVTAQMVNTNVVPVTPGQKITAKGYLFRNTTPSASSACDGSVGIRWTTAAHAQIGGLVLSPQPGGADGGSWTLRSITATAPANAAFAEFVIWMVGNTSGAKIYIDNLSWDYTYQGLFPGLVFVAVQANAALSGKSEPVWPTVGFVGLATLVQDTGVLTVTSVTSGALVLGAAVTAVGIVPGTTITSFGTGVGGMGTYNLSINATATVVTPEAIVVGLTVLDNGVTWEAENASRLIWTAIPILKSGDSQPTFPTVVGGHVVDGAAASQISWRATDGRITDVNCPQTKQVAIGASKIFAADTDVVRFSATTNPLDWTTQFDAGFLPFGLQTYGNEPVSALGLYRSNLLAMNSIGYQMWQIDADPANMALLDASPVGNPYFRSGAPVNNDFVYLTSVGIRSIGIAGASTNLQAGSFGKQVDPLVKSLIAGGYDPQALFFPGTGQYWLIFGSEAVVLTMNGGTTDMSWSRYQFPANIDNWTVLDGVLYLRAGDLVWKVDENTLTDDLHNDILTTVLLHFDGAAGSAVFTDASCYAREVDSAGSILETTQKKFGTAALNPNGSDVEYDATLPELSISNADDFTAEAWIYNTSTAAGAIWTNGSASHSSTYGASIRLDSSGKLEALVGGIDGSSRVAIHDSAVMTQNAWVHVALTREQQVSGWTLWTLYKNGISLGSISDLGVRPDTVTSNATVGGDLAGAFPGYVDEFRVTNGLARYTGNFTPPIAAFSAPLCNQSTPFDGLMWWEYLDFGPVGLEKQLEGFSLVCTGDCTVTVGYNQAKTMLATAPYKVHGDTLGDVGMIPFPVTAKSFQFRLDFGTLQDWEWNSLVVHKI
jgi:hypothetical protein